MEMLQAIVNHDWPNAKFVPNPGQKIQINLT